MLPIQLNLSVKFYTAGSIHLISRFVGFFLSFHKSISTKKKGLLQHNMYPIMLFVKPKIPAFGKYF